MLSGSPLERQLREAIAAEVMRQADQRGGYLSYAELASLAMPDGSRMRLMDPGKGGIWNPAAFVATLSVVTSPDGPYADRELEGGLLKYSYQVGPEGGKNKKLRRAMELRLPVIRFNKVAIDTFSPVFPVYVVEDDPVTREFTLSIDPDLEPDSGLASLSEIQKKYAERLVRQRVHQPAFRARVMLAYRGTCTVCELKKPSLLDAAHIIGDGELAGDAVVSNGLSLCKIHHAAYDGNLLGISPDYRVVISQSVRDESDGPMLLHGLQEMHDRAIVLPSSRGEWPDSDRLATRFDDFLAS